MSIGRELPQIGSIKKQSLDSVIYPLLVFPQVTILSCVGNVSVRYEVTKSQSDKKRKLNAIAFNSIDRLNSFEIKCFAPPSVYTCEFLSRIIIYHLSLVYICQESSQFARHKY